MNESVCNFRLHSIYAHSLFLTLRSCHIHTHTHTHMLYQCSHLYSVTYTINQIFILDDFHVILLRIDYYSSSITPIIIIEIKNGHFIYLLIYIIHMIVHVCEHIFLGSRSLLAFLFYFSMNYIYIPKFFFIWVSYASTSASNLKVFDCSNCVACFHFYSETVNNI